MLFYGLKSCDTCRKAQKELKSAGVDFSYIDVRADGVSRQKIAEWCDKTDWKKLLNTRSATWRGLSDAEKSGIDKQNSIKLLAKYPTLIKRPIIEKDGHIYIGWTAEVKAKLLG